MSFDSALFLAINGNVQSPPWLLALAIFSSLQLPVWVAGGMAGAFLTGGRQVQRCVLKIVVALATAWLVARVLQHLIPVDRPFLLGLGVQWLPHAASPSFPSNHACAAFAFASTVAFSTRRFAWSLAVLMLAALVGWSRVYLGLHYPSDVLVGAVLGASSGWLVNRLWIYVVPRPAVRADFS